MLLKKWLEKNSEGLEELPDIIFGHVDALDELPGSTALTLPIEDGGKVLVNYGQHWAGLDVTFPRASLTVRDDALRELLVAVGYFFASRCKREKGAAVYGGVRICPQDGEWSIDWYIERKSFVVEELARGELTLSAPERRTHTADCVKGNTK